MKHSQLLAPSALFGLFGLFAVLAQPRETSPAKEFMHEKLDRAQSILEGITMENFELVENQAAKLKAMSQDARWQTFGNPEYVGQNELFKRNVNALAKAAKEENLDAATLAYTKMTFSCIECHKWLRTHNVANNP
ncbi:MAG: hypothetical protein ACTHMT_04395 [Verrucomicrobiota bacterium]|jgi:hypothetical protein